MNKRKNETIENNRDNSQSGITLVALVITIIVMLILSAVSINAAIGDNGIISQAQNATYAQSVSDLQEYIDQFYLKEFNGLSDQADNKVEQLAQYQKSSSWFWNPSRHGYGTYNYVVTMDGTIGYFIDKEAFEQSSNITLKGGGAGNGEYIDYARMNDVYGITKDLKVYYCGSGKSSVIGLSENKIDEEDLSRTVFEAGTGFARAISGDSTVPVNFAKVASVKELIIDENSGVDNLNELYNMISLEKLTLDGVNLHSLNGLNNSNITKLMIKNCIIDDYSMIGALRDIDALYFYYTTDFIEAQNEINKIFDINSSKSICNAVLAKLKYFGIFGNDQFLTTINTSILGNNMVIDISGIGNLNSQTKTAVKYMYLNNLSINDCSAISGFTNLNTLIMHCDDLYKLRGVSNMNDLYYLCVRANQNLGKDEVYDNLSDNLGRNSENDAFSEFENISSVISINAHDCDSVRHVSYFENVSIIPLINDDSRIESCVNLENCDNIIRAEVKKLDKQYWAGVLRVDTRFFSCFQSDTDKDYYGYSETSLTNDSDEITELFENTDIIRLRLDGNSELTDTVTGTTKRLSDILASMTNIQVLSLRDITNINSIGFVENMLDLQEIDLIGCTGITDLSPLEKLTTKKINKGKARLGTIRVDTLGTDLECIQKTISRLDGGGRTFLAGSPSRYLVATREIYADLANCTNITDLTFRYCGPTGALDLSKCTKLKNIQIYGNNCTYTLPISLTNLSFSYVLSNAPNIPVGSKLKQVSIGGTNLTKAKLDKWFSQLSNAKELQKLSLSLRDSAIDTLDFSNLNNTKLSNLTITYSEKTCLKNIIGFKHNYLTGVNTLTISNLYKLENISGLQYLTGLTTLTINGTLYNDLSEIEFLTNLETLDLRNNAISSIWALRNLSSLVSLNLENNKIADRSTYNDAEGNSQTYNVLSDVLVKLNAKKYPTNHLTKLYLAGNKGIMNYSPLNSLEWTDKSGF